MQALPGCNTVSELEQWPSIKVASQPVKIDWTCALTRSTNRLCRLAHSISKNHGQPKLAFGLLLRRDSKKGWGGGGGGGRGFLIRLAVMQELSSAAVQQTQPRGGGLEDSKVLGFRC